MTHTAHITQHTKGSNFTVIILLIEYENKLSSKWCDPPTPSQLADCFDSQQIIVEYYSSDF